MIRFFFLDTNTVVSFIYDSCETQRAKHEVHSPYVHLSTIDHRPVEVSKLFHSGFKQIYNMVLATISLPESFIGLLAYIKLCVFHNEKNIHFFILSARDGFVKKYSPNAGFNTRCTMTDDNQLQ